MPNIPVSQGQESHRVENTRDDSGLGNKPESSKARVPLYSHTQNTSRGPDLATGRQAAAASVYSDAQSPPAPKLSGIPTVHVPKVVSGQNEADLLVEPRKAVCGG